MPPRACWAAWRTFPVRTARCFATKAPGEGCDCDDEQQAGCGRTIPTAEAAPWTVGHLPCRTHAVEALGGMRTTVRTRRSLEHLLPRPAAGAALASQVGDRRAGPSPLAME